MNDHHARGALAAILLAVGVFGIGSGVLPWLQIDSVRQQVRRTLEAPTMRPYIRFTVPAAQQ